MGQGQKQGGCYRVCCLQVSADEQKHVLGRRKGNTLSRRSIMKSYKPAIDADQNVLQLDGVADIRKVSTLPIYTAGSCTVQVRHTCFQGRHTPTLIGQQEL